MEEKVREMLKQYQEMRIGKSVVACPYFMNVAKGSVMRMLREVNISEDEIDKFSTKWRVGDTDYGRFQGKGTPEEILSAALEITNKIGLQLSDSEPEVVVEMLKHIGLGIDCSGLVFNLLGYAFEAKGKKQDFIDSLDWFESDKKAASRAGAFVFAGSASIIVEPRDLRSLDLILIKDSKNRYTHIALLVGGENNDFEVIQSSLVTVPTGINVSKMRVEDNKPVFEYKPGLGRTWEEKFEKKELEFRRLVVLQ